MEHPPGRRGFLTLAAATGALASLPAFTATAAPRRPTEPAHRQQPAPVDRRRQRHRTQPLRHLPEAPGRGIFQIDANLGTPAAVAEMLLYSRPGHLELLPALPGAWAAAGSVTGARARGGFLVDLSRRDGKPTEVRIRSVGGTMTSVGYAGTSRTVRMRPGGSVTIRDLAR